MAARKLNVLVYTGTGTTVESVKHCMHSLRRLLSPTYAVIPVTESAIVKEPWAPTCSLFVIPGGADLGYCRVLDGEGNRRIADYVRRGGAYLGFCAGGYYGSQRCEFELENPQLEVIGRRELGFYPGTCRGGAFKGFAYDSEAGARAVKLKVNQDALASGPVKVPEHIKSYYNGGGVFVNADNLKEEGVEVLATYEDHLDVDSGGCTAAAVFCKVGMGSVIVTGPHPEFSAANLSPQANVPGYDKLILDLVAADDGRSLFLQACLAKLGLEIDPQVSSLPPLGPIHLTALNPQDVSEILVSWDEIVEKDSGEVFIRAEQDTFHLQSKDAHGQGAIESLEDDDRIVDYAAVVKTIVHHEESWPADNDTPGFQYSVFFPSLQEFRAKESRAESWGDLMMHSEVLTSTNTILEKNPKLISRLPTGFTLTATTQVAARGRGSNVWLAPAGSLIMSTIINHPAHLGASRPIVFIQYLAAIATVEAIQSYGPGCAKLPIKLKWPNDIYVQDPSGAPDNPQYVKICGILANCSYSAGTYQIVLGIGMNTTNARPTTSLNALLPPGVPPFSNERLVARMLTRLEVLYKTFLRNGFDYELEQKYYRHWLHSGQCVTLEAEGGVRARVLGISRDWGMLMVAELDSGGQMTGRKWTLQSDENSFDYWKGLVRRRT